MAITDKEARDLIFHTIEQLKTATDWNDGRIARELGLIHESYDYHGFLYDPNDIFKAKLQEYKDWYDNLQNAKASNDVKRIRELQGVAGNLMEELAYLTFSALRGLGSIKSYQSYNAQHDLVITGSSSTWFGFLELLHINQIRRTILVEVKNLDEPVTDSQMSRLCSILQNKLDSTSGS